MQISTLLDKAREHCSLKSDAALAARIGVTRAIVSHWRKTGKWPEPDVIARLARAAGDDAGPWMVAAELSRSGDAHAKRAWRRIAELLGHAAAVALVAILMNSPALSQTPERFTAALKSTTYQGTSIHYAQ